MNVSQQILWGAWWPRDSVSIGPEVIKLFSCSTQLSMKFHWLINAEIVKISVKSKNGNLSCS